MTLLLTTHYMEEAEALADRVGIIDHGRVVAEGSPRELTEKMGADVVRIQGRGDFAAFCQEVEALPYVQSCNTGNGLLQIGVDSGNRRLAEVVTLANDNGYAIEDIALAKPTLGDVFLRYTGRQLRDK